MHKSLDGRKIRVIPAATSHAPESPRDKAILRTAAYCRVSSDKKEQETSFDNQVIYYTNLINTKPDWTLAQIYADPAVSGTSRRNRVQFDQMIYDCIHGKVDQIITKSMSRFARNQLDSLAVIRLLR
jgi:site-specific DNA recombinase